MYAELASRVSTGELGNRKGQYVNSSWDHKIEEEKYFGGRGGPRMAQCVEVLVTESDGHSLISWN